MPSQLAPLFCPRNEIPEPLANNPLSYPHKPVNTYKISVWNVRSLKDCGSAKKQKYIEAESPDIIIICESGWENVEDADELYYLRLRYPYRYWKTGVAVLASVKPVAYVQYGFDGAFNYIQEDAERRCITLEFENVFVIESYVSNSGKEGQFKKRRHDFNSTFRSHISYIQKPIIWGADLNVVFREDDIELFRECRQKMPGCVDWERVEHGPLLDETGFVDAGRVQHPTAREYT